MSKRNIKISALKYYGIIGMLFLHASYLLMEQSIAEIMITSIAGIALPLFFFLSAYYYCKQYITKEDTMVFSKIKRLIVPYILWQLIAILMYKMSELLHIPCDKVLPNSAYQVIRSTYLGSNNAPLWYLKVLFVLFLLSPSLIDLVKENKYLAGGGGYYFFLE